MADTNLYFAYGSNLNFSDLRVWCDKSKKDDPLERRLRRGRARLPDMELGFNYRSASRGNKGTLNVRRRRGQVVEGWLFEIDQDAWRVLDQKEGAPSYYQRKPVHVIDESGVIVEAWTYTVTPKKFEDFVPPTQCYLDVVRTGRESFGLETTQLDAAAKNAPPKLALDAIFVYGTLLRGEKRFAALQDRAEFECILLATTQGRMLDFDLYPAVLPDSNHEIIGEFMRFRNVSEVLESLDHIEGFNGYAAESESLYHRALTTVDAGDGYLRQAWIYMLTDSGKGRPKVPSGNWRQHLGRYGTFRKNLFETYCGQRETEVTKTLAGTSPFSVGNNHEEAVQSLTPLLGKFLDGTVPEHYLAEQTGKWVCIPTPGTLLKASTSSAT
jgi:gamma-glutamylcyclotransferase (GGCT)/AIG2-like uncharacterized protein YtfP